MAHKIFDSELFAEAQLLFITNTQNATPQKFVSELESWISEGHIAAFRTRMASMHSGPSVICGKVFKAGELAYNCRQCQTDSTCVLCEACFRDSDHKGHDVTFHRTQPGGTCDCGDSEAFSSSCSRHGAKNSALDPADALERGERARLLAAFVALLQFVAETAQSVRQKYDESLLFDGSAPSGGVEGAGEADLALVVHNDDIHTYDQVRDTLMKCGYKYDEATKLTVRVDKEGDVVVKTGKRGAIASAVAHIRNAKLFYTVEPKQLHDAQKLATSLLNWMKDMCALNDAVAKVVADSWIFDPAGGEDAKRQQASPQLVTVLATIYHQPKHMRVAENDIFIMLLKFAEFRFGLGLAYCAAYAGFMGAFAGGQGVQTDAVFHLAVQVFTVPSLVTTLMQSGGVREIIKQLWAVMSHAAVPVVPNELPSLPQVAANGKVLRSPATLDCSSYILQHNKYVYVAHDLEYIFRSPGVCEMVLKDAGPGGMLETFVDSLALCQAADPHHRLRFAHAEYESLIWANAFNLELRLSGLQSALLENLNVKQLSPESDQWCWLPSSCATVARSLLLWSFRKYVAERSISSSSAGYLRILPAAIVESGSESAERPPRKKSAQSGEQQGEQPIFESRSSGAPTASGGQQHLTALGTLGSFPSIASLDPSKDDVSFHHPLSRFLPELVERIVVASTQLLDVRCADSAVSSPVDELMASVASFLKMPRHSLQGYAADGTGCVRHVRVSLAPRYLLSNCPGAVGKLDGALLEPLKDLVAAYPSLTQILQHTGGGDNAVTATLLGLAVLEQPLRTLIASMHGKARLWVRNGQTFSSQLQNYAGPPQSLHFMDPDIKAVQLAALLLTPQHVIETLVRRTGLLPWLLPGAEIADGTNLLQATAGAPDKSTPTATALTFSTLQAVEMQRVVPELLKLLCIITTELPIDPEGQVRPADVHFQVVEGALGSGYYSAGADLQYEDEMALLTPLASAETADTISASLSAEISVIETDNTGSLRTSVRRNLIHFLASGPKSRSAISKFADRLALHRGKLDEGLVTSVLGDISDYRPPTGMESGVYVLKEALFDEYDQFFYHLDPANHREAFETWTSKRKKGEVSRSILKDLEFAKPISPPPPPTIPAYAGVRHLLHSVATMAVVRRALETALSESADAGITAAVHLLTLSLYTASTVSATAYENVRVSEVFTSALISARLCLPFGAAALLTGDATTVATTDVAGKRKREAAGIADGWYEEDALSRRSIIEASTDKSILAMLLQIYKTESLQPVVRDGAIWCISRIRKLSVEANKAFEEMAAADLDAAAAHERSLAEAARKAELDARKKAAQARAMAAMAKQQNSVLSHLTAAELGEDDDAIAIDGRAIPSEISALVEEVSKEYAAISQQAPLPFGFAHEIATKEKHAAVERDKCILCGENRQGSVVQLGFVEPSKVLNWTTPQSRDIRKALALRYTLLATSEEVPGEDLSSAEAELFMEMQRGTSEIQPALATAEVLAPLFPGKTGQLSHIPFTSEAGLFVNFCGHYAHSDCMQKYLTSSGGGSRDLHMDGAHHLRTDNGEFLCPLCRNLSNLLVPVEQSPTLSPITTRDALRTVQLLLPLGTTNCCADALQFAERCFRPPVVAHMSERQRRLLVRCGLHVDYYSAFLPHFETPCSKVKDQLALLHKVVSVDVKLNRIPIWDYMDTTTSSDEIDGRRTGITTIGRNLLDLQSSLAAKWLSRRRQAGEAPVEGMHISTMDMYVSSLFVMSYTLRASSVVLTGMESGPKSGPDAASLLDKYTKEYATLFTVLRQVSRLLMPAARPLVGGHNLRQLERYLRSIVPSALQESLPKTLLEPARKKLFTAKAEDSMVAGSALLSWLAAAADSSSSAATLLPVSVVAESAQHTSSSHVTRADTAGTGHADFIGGRAGDRERVSSPGADHGVGQEGEDEEGEDSEDGEDDEDEDDSEAYEDDDDYEGSDDDDTVPRLNMDGFTFTDAIAGDDGIELDDDMLPGENAGLNAGDVLRNVIQAAMAGIGQPRTGALAGLFDALRANLPPPSAHGAGQAASKDVAPPTPESLFLFREKSYQPLLHHPVHRLLGSLLVEGHVNVPQPQSNSCEEILAFLVAATRSTSPSFDAAPTPTESSAAFALDVEMQAALKFVRSQKELHVQQMSPLHLAIVGSTTATSPEYAVSFVSLAYLLLLAQMTQVPEAEARARGTSLLQQLRSLLRVLEAEGDTCSNAFEAFAADIPAVVAAASSPSSLDDEQQDAAMFLRLAFGTKPVDSDAVLQHHAALFGVTAVAVAKSPLALISLPTEYDTLYGRLGEAKCDLCDTHPEDAALCLVCGMLVCAGSQCCKSTDVQAGEVTRHAMSCGGGTGIFLLTATSQTLLVRNEFSAYYHSVYVDVHGEQDPGLRRGKPLFLSPARYAVLNELWVRHQVGREVSRIRQVADRVIRTNYY